MKIISIILLVVFAFNLYALDRSTEWIDIEWDEVPKAIGYDLELTETIDQKEYSRGIFHTDNAHWSKETAPGNYFIKIRAIDARKVPGHWGDSIPVRVNLKTAQLLNHRIKRNR